MNVQHVFLEVLFNKTSSGLFLFQLLKNVSDWHSVSFAIWSKAQTRYESKSSTSASPPLLLSCLVLSLMHFHVSLFLIAPCLSFRAAAFNYSSGYRQRTGSSVVKIPSSLFLCGNKHTWNEQDEQHKHTLTIWSFAGGLLPRLSNTRECGS